MARLTGYLTDISSCSSSALSLNSEILHRQYSSGYCSLPSCHGLRVLSNRNPNFSPHRTPVSSRQLQITRVSSSFDDQFISNASSFDSPSFCSHLSFYRPDGLQLQASKLHSSEHSVVYRDLKESMPTSLLSSASFFASVGALTQTKPSSCSSPTTECVSLNGSSIDTKGTPMSLRILKMKNMRQEIRKNNNLQKHYRVIPNRKYDKHAQKKDNLVTYSQYDSLVQAFAHLVFMIKMLQCHALKLRKMLLLIESESFSLQEVTMNVHNETQESLLWLFQEIFSSTPNFMIHTMMVLAEFTFFSMSRHLPLGVMPDIPSSTVDNSYSSREEKFMSYENLHTLCENKASVSQSDILPVELASLTEASNLNVSSDYELISWKGRRRISGTSTVPVVTSEIDSEIQDSLDDSQTLSSFSSVDAGSSSGHIEARCLHYDGDRLHSKYDSLVIDNFLKHIMKSLGMDYMKSASSALDAMTKEMLVAPVLAPKLESDEYACYDKTDINYMLEISLDPENTLLLSNYAQFMHLVRHDNSRAEQLYLRALRVDPLDGEIMVKFANFLWVAKGNVSGAEAAYRAAMMSDPNNSHQAGCYAHFLWNNGGSDHQTEEPNLPTTYYQSNHISTS